MSLQIWLPLRSNLMNYGVSGLQTASVQSGVATSADGKLGQCYKNSGTTANVTTTINLTVTAFTMCSWVRVDTQQKNWCRAWGLIGSDSAYMGLCCEHTNGTLGFHYYKTYNGTNTGIFDTYPCSAVVGTWVHYAMAYDGAKYYIYVNGSLIASAATTKTNVETTITGLKLFGGNGSYSSKHSLTDVRLYDHCLSPKEVKEISKALVVHFPLGDEFIEGTTNLVASQYISASSGTGWGGHTSVWSIEDASNFPIPARQCNKISITYSGSGGGGVGRDIKNIASCSPSTTYTYSCYVRTPDELAPLNNNILYRYEKNSSGTQVTEAGCWTNHNNYQYLGDNWYRLWGTFTVSSTTTNFRVCSFVYPNKTCNYYIGCWQLELKDHVTPYIFGTRNETIIHDTSGFKNNGTLNAAFKCLTDTPRYLYSTFFDGNTNCILFPFDAARSSDGIFTMNLWFKKTEIGSKNYESLVGGPSGFEMDTRAGSSTTLSLYMASTRGGNMFSPFELNQWYMVTMVNDGTNEKYYVNGSLKNTIAKKSMPTGNYYIGSWRDTTSQNYKGMISDFRLYNTALSDTDILQLYQTSASIDSKGNILGYEFNE